MSVPDPAVSDAVVRRAIRKFSRALVAAARSGAPMPSLSLAGERDVCARGCALIAEALKTGRELSALQVLDLSRCRLCTGVQETGTGCDHPRAGRAACGDPLEAAFARTQRKGKPETPATPLGAETVDDDTTGVVALAASVLQTQSAPPCNLTALTLAGNALFSEGAEALCDALRRNRLLTVLDISRCMITAAPTAGHWGAFSAGVLDGLEALGRLVQINHTIVDLDISHNDVNEGDCSGFRAVSDALEVNRTLTVLRCRGNQFGEEGAFALGRAMRLNGTLAVLDLQANRLGVAGTVHLCDALAGASMADGTRPHGPVHKHLNRSLRELDIGQNLSGAEGGAACAAMVLQHTGLEVLRVDKSSFGSRAWEALADSLLLIRQETHSLRRIVAPRNYMGAAGAKAMARAIRRGRCMTALDMSDNGNVGGSVSVTAQDLEDIGWYSRKTPAATDAAGGGVVRGGARRQYLDPATGIWGGLPERLPLGLCALSSALVANTCVLRSLSLAGCQIDDAGIATLLPALEGFRLLAAGGAAAVVKRRPLSLTELDLSNSSFTASPGGGAELLLRTLERQAREPGWKSPQDQREEAAAAQQAAEAGWESTMERKLRLEAAEAAAKLSGAAGTEAELQAKATWASPLRLQRVTMQGTLVAAPSPASGQGLGGLGGAKDDSAAWEGRLAASLRRAAERQRRGVGLRGASRGHSRGFVQSTRAETLVQQAEAGAVESPLPPPPPKGLVGRTGRTRQRPWGNIGAAAPETWGWFDDGDERSAGAEQTAGNGNSSPPVHGVAVHFKSPLAHNPFRSHDRDSTSRDERRARSQLARGKALRRMLAQRAQAEEEETAAELARKARVAREAAAAEAAMVASRPVSFTRQLAERAAAARAAAEAEAQQAADDAARTAGRAHQVAAEGTFPGIRQWDWQVAGPGRRRRAKKRAEAEAALAARPKEWIEAVDPSLDEEAPGGNRYWLNASMSGEVRWTHPPQGELVRNAELPLIVQADQRARNAAKAERTLAEAAATKSLSKAEWLELLQVYPNPSHQQWALNELHAWAVDGPASEHLGLMRKPSQFTTATIELAASLGANKMQLQGMHILVYFNGVYWKKGQPGAEKRMSTKGLIKAKSSRSRRKKK